MRALWNDAVIAESDVTKVVEGNHYFPADSVRPELLVPSETTTVCPWKGTASYYSLSVDGKENPDAAWVYQDPKPEAAHLKGHIGHDASSPWSTSVENATALCRSKVASLSLSAAVTRR